MVLRKPVLSQNIRHVSLGVGTIQLHPQHTHAHTPLTMARFRAAFQRAFLWTAIAAALLAIVSAASAVAAADASTPLMFTSTEVEDSSPFIDEAALVDNAITDDDFVTDDNDDDTDDATPPLALASSTMHDIDDDADDDADNSDDDNFGSSSIASLISAAAISTTTLLVDVTNQTIAGLAGALQTVNEDGANCQEGLMLPVWLPQDHLTFGDRLARGSVYFIIMLYLFIGVSIVSDRFMAAIEVITSKEKEVKVTKANGEVQIVVVRVWNETVANLTLMALGSSAPEILLSIIEIMAKNFNAGELGPGTIVGSAAYNLFVIIAVCVWVIPPGEVRKIKHLRVFFVTATWSLFAYIWLYLILAYFSPGQVDIWEGFLTFLFFPLTVLTAYIADKRLLVYKYISKEYRMNKRGVMVQTEAEASAFEMSNGPRPSTAGDEHLKAICENGDVGEEMRDFEEARREYIIALKELRQRYPQSTLESLEIMAQEQLMNKGPKSRAFYRIQATRKMMGSGNIMRKISERAQSDLSEVKAELQRVEVDEDWDESIARIFFEPSHYTVMESCEEFEVRVVRRGDMSGEVTVDFETEDGSAEAGSDYVGKKGTLRFPPGVDEQRFKIEVIDDDVFEQDEHFYVRLANVSEPSVLVQPKVATVMILDDDHGGIFAFAAKDHELVESVGMYEVKVQRYSGARGRVQLAFWTEDGTAKAGRDYAAQSGELVFDNNESE